MGIKFGGGEALVAGKTTAMNAFGDDHLLATVSDDVDQALRFAQVLGATGYVHGDRRLLWVELQALEQLFADEFDRVV